MFLSNFFAKRFGSYPKKLYLCIRFRERTTLEANADRVFEKEAKKKEFFEKDLHKTEK